MLYTMFCSHSSVPLIFTLCIVTGCNFICRSYPQNRAEAVFLTLESGSEERKVWKHIAHHLLTSSRHVMPLPVSAFAGALGQGKGKLCPAPMEKRQKRFKGGQRDGSFMLLGFESVHRTFYLEGLQLSKQDHAA